MGPATTATSPPPTTELPPLNFEGLDRFVQYVMSCRNTIGLSLSLVRAGKTELAKGYGHQDLDKKKAMENTTLLNIASISKAFTTTLLADAVSRGQLAWNRPLRQYIPGFKLSGPDNIRTNYASIRDAVSHRIGFPNYWGVSMACLNVSRQELVRLVHKFYSIC